MRPEPLEERRKRLARLLSRRNKALRDGIQVSEAITGDGATIFRHACWMDLEGIVSPGGETSRSSRAGCADDRSHRWFPSIPVLQIVRPETLVRWHRAGFRSYWRWKSRNRGGRPADRHGVAGSDPGSSLDNPLWAAGTQFIGPLIRTHLYIARFN